MSLFLKIVLIAYIVLAYIAAIVMVLAVYNFSKKMQKKQGGKQVMNISLGKLIPIALFAPISLPIVLLVALWFKSKQ